MKKLIATLLLLCVASYAGKAQTEETKDLRYGLIAEFGMYGGYKNFGATAIFVNNIVIKEKFVAGIGLGMEMEIADAYSIPMFFNFRYYLPSKSKKNFQPLINAALGMRLCMQDFYHYDEYGREEISVDFYPGLYATLTTGFKVKAFSFTTGLFFKTGDWFYGGVEVKCGFTF